MTYEVWSLDGGNRCVGKFRVPLDPEEVAVPISAYLRKQDLLHIEFPIHISSNARVFSVLQRIFVITADADLNNICCVSAAVPSPSQLARGRLNGRTEATSVPELIFCPLGRHVAVVEQQPDGEDGIAVSEYNVDGQQLVVEPLFLKFAPQIKRTSFHPTLAIIVWAGLFADAKGLTTAGIVAWQFRKGTCTHLRHASAAH